MGRWLRLCHRHSLREMLCRRRHFKPRMHCLFPDGQSRRRKVGISEASDRDAIAVGASVAFRKNVASAIRAEMEADFSAAGSVPLINVVIALDPNLAFRIGAAGMDHGPRAALTRPTMTNIDELRLTRGDEPKRTAMALCRSLHILFPLSPLQQAPPSCLERNSCQPVLSLPAPLAFSCREGCFGVLGDRLSRGTRQG
jgi:hypothetical protein